MASRARPRPHSEGSQPTRRVGPVLPARSRLQRSLFTFAVITFAFASFFSASNLLSRAWPAIFPGEEFSWSSLVPGSQPLLDSLPVDVTSHNEDSAFNRRRNFLILGLDTRPDTDDLGDHNTDVIIVASIDPVTKRSTLLSFPRDLWVDISLPDGSIFQERINASYAYGLEQGEGTAADGAAQVKTDLMNNFGISIDNWVVLDFRGVRDLIDALGGVTVDIPPELEVPEWRYSDDDLNGVTVSFPPGVTELDGYHAVAFGRFRGDNAGDLNRIKRQQLVISAAVDKLNASTLLANPVDAWNAYRKLVTTDVSNSQVIGLANLFRQSQENLQTYSVADPVNGLDTVFGFVTESGAQVLDWNRENVQYWIDLALSGSQTYAESDIEVRNGFGADGLDETQALANFLHNQGMPTVYVGADAEWHDQTEIVLYREEARLQAEDIAAWLGIPLTDITLMPADDADQPAIAVVVGADYAPPGG